MPPVDDDDWSDSDEEAMSEVETSVLLGTPDGAITAAADLADAAVSRIGGHPVRSTPMYRCVEFDSFMTCQRPSFHRMSLHFLPRSAKHALGLWSFSFRCGVRSRTAPWTGRSMYGAAQFQSARLSQAGA
jgi:pre-rRNA-processing protein TSR4